MSQSRFEPPLSADDPRVSEWLDGRLPEAEAVEIARLVAASAEVTRLVDDLRRQKAAVAALPVSPPPVGFVQDVLAALDTAGDTAGDDAEVEEEWRRIERERLEEEIAEARADAAAPVDEPLWHRWPWLALAGALAAGVLATLVINRPGDRDVALVERQLDRTAGKPGDPQRREEDRDQWLEEAAKAGDLRAANGSGGGSGDAAARPQLAAPAPEDAVPQRVRAVTYRIRTAADRERLESLLAASGWETGRRSNREPPARARRLAEALEKAAANNAAEAAGAPQADGVADKKQKQAEMQQTPSGGQTTERISVSGPADMIDRLAVALEGTQAPKAAAGFASQPIAPPAEPAAKRAAAREIDVTLVIEVVDESGVEAGGGEDRP